MSDEARAGVLCLLWTIALGISGHIRGTAGLLVLVLATVVCIVYVLYDRERERRRQERKLADKMFKNHMAELRGGKND